VSGLELAVGGAEAAGKFGSLPCACEARLWEGVTGGGVVCGAICEAVGAVAVPAPNSPGLVAPLVAGAVAVPLVPAEVVLPAGVVLSGVVGPAAPPESAPCAASDQAAESSLLKVQVAKSRGQR
jgi:hypothetical protein